eukprot:TRINITY_DN48902_c0_g1_i1.p1 TRINITY_DN48902_c0_g1~~TRINITY_DN48902_c0_g1_i1.p1  ORF type:complete len:212 (+),score=36.15 TRINITY_DN48902_c0_g1_i1:38-673(+)
MAMRYSASFRNGRVCTAVIAFVLLVAGGLTPVVRSDSQDVRQDLRIWRTKRCSKDGVTEHCVGIDTQSVFDHCDDFKTNVRLTKGMLVLSVVGSVASGFLPFLNSSVWLVLVDVFTTIFAGILGNSIVIWRARTWCGSSLQGDVRFIAGFWLIATGFLTTITITILGSMAACCNFFDDPDYDDIEDEHHTPQRDRAPIPLAVLQQRSYDTA